MKRTERIRLGIEIYKRKVLEYARFDSRIARLCLLCMYLLTYWMVSGFGWKVWTVDILGRIYRHIDYECSRIFACRGLGKLFAKHGIKKIGNIVRIAALTGDDVEECRRLKKSIAGTSRPFDRRLIILAPPDKGRKGVILVKFTDYFRYFASVFNLSKLGKDYILVAEPSFSGYFDPDVLSLLSGEIITVVQAPEPVDSRFIENLHENWYAVDVGSNCWVNPDVFYPIEEVKKKYDVIMVAIWADFKRHWHLFESLSRCRRKNEIRVVLVGRPWPKSREDIMKQAEYFNVRGNIVAIEDVSQVELNQIMSQSKIFLLLSRKEGPNKAIIEAMYANLPVFLLNEFNYGFKYEYINPKTGGFVKKDQLTDFLDNIDDILGKNRFAPHNWVKCHISSEISTEKLIRVLERIEKDRGVAINKKLAVKVNTPELDYLDPNVWSDMKKYYQDLVKYLS